jgi:pimeloyl-ACP methyl ester carboxylesterase
MPTIPQSRVRGPCSVVRSHAIVVAAALALVVAAAPAAAQQSAPGPDAKATRLVLQKQGSFYVGGHVQHTDATSSTPGGFLYPNEDDIMINQMYVQYQIPVSKARHVAVVMLHGCCLSGKTWETTPDGRMGWAEYFVRQKRPVYVPDQSSRARSGFDATVINEVKLGLRPVSDLPDIFIFGREAAWDLFRFGPAYPRPFADEQFPVEAMKEFGKQVIPDLNATLPARNPTWVNLAALARRVDGAILMGHSESGFFPQQAALIDPRGVRGAISIEGGCLTTLNAQQLAVLAQIPELIVYGDHLTGSPGSADLWQANFNGCKQFVDQINSAGGDATMLHLPDAGQFGNSHMLMQDKNNLVVADMLLDWIDGHVEKKGH